jgi:hypothetical protein
VHDGRAIYLLYNGILKDKTRSAAATSSPARCYDILPKFAGPKVIYAAANRHGQPAPPAKASRLNKHPTPWRQQARRMVERGWAADVDSIIAESLRRYLESHQERLSEQFIREDVEWGLKGSD